MPDCTGVCRHHPCPDCAPKEHRGSRPLDADVDASFTDAAFRPFTAEEKQMVEEKLPERARKAGAI